MKKRSFSLLALLALLLSLVIPPAGKGSASVLPEVDPLLADAGRLAEYTSLDSVTAIVTYRSRPTADDLALLRTLELKALPFKHLPMVAVKGPHAAIQALFARPEILSVYYDKPLRYLLNESVPYIGADRVWSELGYTGQGVTVAVIDSGVDAGHPDLKLGEKTVQNVKLLVGNDIFGGEPVYLENVENTDTSSGHGTHVAGTIAGTGAASNGRYKGAAPGAKLVGIGTGEGLSILWALEGFDYVLDKREQYNIRVVSNSWGTTGEYSPNDPVNVASKKAHDAGITVVFAAGNEGPDEGTLNPYSVAPWVIGVAAGTKDGRLADFSSRGVPGDDLLHPTITAPGVNIVSARSRGGTVMNGLDAADDAVMIPAEYLPHYTTASGTSMATPHVSGVAALMLEANPSLTPDLLKQVMTDTARPMEGYGMHEVGAGYIDAYAATAKAVRVRVPDSSRKEPKTGKEYPTYEETETWSGLIGPGAAEAGVPSSHEYALEAARDTVNLTVSVDWTSVASDLDLYVYGPDGRLAGKSAQGLGTHEETVIPDPAPGTYRVKVEGWLTVSETYRGTAVHEKILRQGH